MLLSEKDSVVYPRCLAPELRSFRFPHNVHRVPDYMGVGPGGEAASASARSSRSRVTHGYTHIFAGYGFMAEDAEFIEAIERAGRRLHGPVVARGAPAPAPRTRRRSSRAALGNAVIPGVDDVSARALLARGEGPRARSRRSPRSTASRSPGTRRASSRRTPRRCCRPATRRRVELVDDRGAAGRGRARLRARSGATTRTTASASSTSAAAAARASAWSRSPSEVAAAVMDVLRRVEGGRRRARTGTS